MKNTIEYFEKPGKVNTLKTLEISKKRALELGIKQVLLASTHGYTAKEAAKVFEDTDIEIIAVTISDGYEEKGWCMKPEVRHELESSGIKVLTTQHALSGGAVESFDNETSFLSIIADTLYCFSQGMKVALEIAVMAVENKCVSADIEIISIAGTSEGADTAIVLVPPYARKFKEARIREILCKPRVG